MLSPLVQSVELSVPDSATKSVALPFTLSLTLSFAIALLPSREVMAASRTGMDQASTRFIHGRELRLEYFGRQRHRSCSSNERVLLTRLAAAVMAVMEVGTVSAVSAVAAVLV